MSEADRDRPEAWKDIPDYAGYQASDLGRIKGLDRVIKYARTGKPVSRRQPCKILKQIRGGGGYLYVSVRDSDKNNRRRIYTHKLVLMAFVENKHGKPQGNHIDGNKLNNKVENLEWVTCSENLKHALDTGLRKVKRRSDNPNSRITEKQRSHIETSDVPTKELAAEYGLTQRSVAYIKRDYRDKLLKS